MPRNKRRCRRNCPEAEAANKAAAKVASEPVLSITSNSEGERLWRHVTVGASTCIYMIEQYEALDMPGIPLETLESLRDRLQTIVNKYKAEANADSDSAQ